MRLNKLHRSIASIFLGLMLLFGVSATAQAQHRHHSRRSVVVVPRYRPYWGFYPYWNRTLTVVDPIAQQRESGYSDGHKRGESDAKHGKPNAPASHKHYRDSDSMTYRQAFLQGYADGYRERMDRVG